MRIDFNDNTLIHPSSSSEKANVFRSLVYGLYAIATLFLFPGGSDD